MAVTEFREVLEAVNNDDLTKSILKSLKELSKDLD